MPIITTCTGSIEKCIMVEHHNIIIHVLVFLACQQILHYNFLVILQLVPSPLDYLCPCQQQHCSFYCHWGYWSVGVGKGSRAQVERPLRITPIAMQLIIIIIIIMDGGGEVVLSDPVTSCSYVCSLLV